MAKKNRLSSTLGAVGIFQILSLGLGILSSIFLSRWLEPTGRGNYVFMLLVAQITGLLLDFGLPNAYATFFLRGEIDFQQIFSNALTLVYIRIGASVLVITCVWLFWPKFYALGIWSLILVISYCIVTFLFTLNLSVLFTKGDMGKWFIVKVVTLFLSFSLIFVCWLCSVVRDSKYAMLISLFALFIGLCFEIIFIRKYVELRPTKNISVIRSLMKFSSKNMLNNLIWDLGNRADLYVVGILLSPSTLGIYSLATSMAGTIQGLLMTIPQSLYPSQAVGETQDQQVEIRTAMAVRISIILGALLAILLILVIPFIVPLFFGKDYNSAIIPIVILSVNAVLFAPFHLFGGYMNGRKMRPEITSIFGGIMVTISLVGCLLLIPEFGIIGAAIANLVSTLIALVLFSVYISRTMGLSLRDLFIIKTADLHFIARFIADIVIKLKHFSLLKSSL